MLKPIDNGIYFIFADDTTNTNFINQTKAGLIVKGGPQAEVPRWGAVIRIGADVETVQVGDCILIEKGMWTSSFETGGMKLWKTDEEHVLAISDEPEAVL